MAFSEHLPLVRSTQETIDQWSTLSRRQKLGAAAASFVTVMGPVSRFFSEKHQGQNESPTRGELIANVAIDLRDGLDGKVARLTGGVTPFGKEVDPFADKADFFIQEWHEYRRGNLPLVHLIARFSRDAIITVLRAHVMAASDGNANVGADILGKWVTAGRQGSNRITGLPVEKNNSRLRAAHQGLATGALIISGANNVRRLLKERAKYSSAR